MLFDRQVPSRIYDYYKKYMLRYSLYVCLSACLLYLSTQLYYHIIIEAPTRDVIKPTLTILASLRSVVF